VLRRALERFAREHAGRILDVRTGKFITNEAKAQ
jgi:hypothetical protein